MPDDTHDHGHLNSSIQAISLCPRRCQEVVWILKNKLQQTQA